MLDDGPGRIRVLSRCTSSGPTEEAGLRLFRELDRSDAISRVELLQVMIHVVFITRLHMWRASTVNGLCVLTLKSADTGLKPTN